MFGLVLMTRKQRKALIRQGFQYGREIQAERQLAVCRRCQLFTESLVHFAMKPLASEVAEEISEIGRPKMVVTKKKTCCYFCGNTENLKPYMYMYVGGSGPVIQYQCADEAACKGRREAADKEWRAATCGPTCSHWPPMTSDQCTNCKKE